MSAADIAEKLTGEKGKKRGCNYLIKCPAHEDGSPSLSIRDGNDGKLLVCCFAGCSGRDVLDAIRAKIGGEIGTVQPDPLAAKGSAEYQRQQHDKARWLWSQRCQIINSIAEQYLRSREIACPLPPTLAFLPTRKQHHPALISAFGLCDEPEPGVITAPRDVAAVHLTLLKPNGSGKAKVEKPKLVIGSPGGRPIVVAPANDFLGLTITEGIEDALSVHAATGLGAWAAGSAGFLPKLADAVPNYIEAVTIYAHTDKAGRDGAHKLAAKLRDRNIEVTIEGLDRDG